MEEDTVTHSQSIKVELMMNSSTGSSHQPEASPTCETPPLKMVAGRSDESLRAADQPCTSSHKNVCEGFAAHTGTILVKKKNRGCMPYGGFMPSICCPCKSPSGEYCKFVHLRQGMWSCLQRTNYSVQTVNAKPYQLLPPNIYKLSIFYDFVIICIDGSYVTADFKRALRPF